MAFESEFIRNTLDPEFHVRWLNANRTFLPSDWQPFFLCSFPRSGNGWVRLVLSTVALDLNLEDAETLELAYKEIKPGVHCNCLSIADQTAAGQTTADRTISVEDIFPDIYQTDVNESSSSFSWQTGQGGLLGRMLKTHHIVDCEKAKTIFLFRDPLPCLVSAALFFNRKQIETQPSAINPTVTFLAKYYRQLLWHFVNQKAVQPENVLFVSHESIATNSSHYFEAILKFMGLNCRRDVLDKVVDRFAFRSTYQSQFEKHLDSDTRLLIEEIRAGGYSEALQQIEMVPIN